MSTKQLPLIGAVIVLLIFVGAAYFSRTPSSPQGPQVTPGQKESAPGEAQTPAAKTPASKNQTSPPKQAPQTTAQGERVLFAITDKAAEGGDIRSIFVTVSEVRAHEPRQGWITIPTGTKKFDLLELKRTGVGGIYGFLGEGRLKEGTYTQLTLTVSEVNVVKFDGSTYAAKLPSNTIKFIRQLTVRKGETATVVFDFEADRSLHETGDGKYIFLPVIKFSAGVRVVAEMLPGNRIRVGSGVAALGAPIGMDENGDALDNYALHPATDIELLGETLKLRPYDLSEEGLAVDAKKALDTALGGRYLDRASSIRLLREGISYYWRIAGQRGGARATVDVHAASGAVIIR